MRAVWNDRDEVRRLLPHLLAGDPARWKPDALSALPDLPPEEREEELALVRDWWPELVEIYRSAAAAGETLVGEDAP